MLPLSRGSGHRARAGGSLASGVRGYGTARPAGLNDNGDPTGIVTGLTWSSWGGANALGAGAGQDHGM